MTPPQLHYDDQSPRDEAEFKQHLRLGTRVAHRRIIDACKVPRDRLLRKLKLEVTDEHGEDNL